MTVDIATGADQKAPGQDAIASTASLRDALSKSWDDVERASVDNTDPAKPSEGETGGKDQSAAAPGDDKAHRDEQGRFAKAEGEEGAKAATPPKPAEPNSVAQPGTTGTDPVASTPPVSPPPGWSQEAKAEWAKLSPAIQAAVVKREGEVSAGFKQYSDQVKRHQEIEQVLAPRRQNLQARGLNEGQVINNLFGLADAYENDAANTVSHLIRSSRDPRGTLAGVLQHFGIDPSTLAQSPSAAPTQVPQIDPNWVVQQAERRATQVAQQQANEQLQAYIAQQQIAEFQKNNPHFERLKPVMGRLMTATHDGQGRMIAPPLAETLPDAYQKALALDPELQAQIKAQEEAKRAAEAVTQEEKRKQDEADRLAKARAAGSSVTGSPPVGAGRAAKPKSIRENLEEGFKQSGGRL